MAKAKGKSIVGWGVNMKYATGITVLAEKDVNQVRNRKSGQGGTWSKGHIVRQLGIATQAVGGYSTIPAATVYSIYTHSQISNAFGYQPAAYVALTHDDLEWLWMQIGQELFGEKKV